MRTQVVAGSDARVRWGALTDRDGAPAFADAPPVVTVESVTLGPLSAGVVTEGDAPGVYVCDLSAHDHTGVVDVLHLRWSATVSGAVRTAATVVDVAGGQYIADFELAQQRTVSGVGVPLWRAAEWRQAFESLAERARGVAFVHRMAVEAHVSTGAPVTLSLARPVSVSAVWCDGVPVDVGTVTIDGPTLSGLPDGVCRVAYIHGYESPPGELVEACRMFVRAKILSAQSDIGRNVASFTNLATGESYRYQTADWGRGRFTGLEDVDALIAAVPDERVPGVG